MARPLLDAVVIGAGAAGLSAARELSQNGLRIALLEARERIGGRIHTLHDAAWPGPVELGAEFLHGEAEATREIARVRKVVLRFREAFWDEEDFVAKRLGSSNGRMERPDLRVLAVPLRRLEDGLDGWAEHDWQADPCSRGAYTYVAVGGGGAPEALALPLAGTLYFAGEAADADEMGTVAGALASGRRAARSIVRSL